MILSETGPFEEEVSSFRPTCQLDTVGRLLLEGKGLAKVDECPEESHAMVNLRQFDFCKGCSTVDVITKVVEIGRKSNEQQAGKYDCVR